MTKLPETPRELQALYPYQFVGKNIGISVSRGHFKLFAELCGGIDNLLGNDKQGFHWSQVKEKFGSMRFYWSMEGVREAINIDLISTVEHAHISKAAKAEKANKQELTDAITELVNVAASKTAEVCCACGEPGTVDQTGGYVLMLCQQHKNARKKNRQCGADIWWSEGEDFE